MAFGFLIAVGADGAGLATVVCRWRGLGASGERLFLKLIAAGYEEDFRKYWTGFEVTLNVRTRLVSKKG